MNIDNILQDLDAYLQKIVDNTPEVQQKVNKTVLDGDKAALLEERFSGWQAPIKGIYYNSGAYGLGDERHKGKHEGVDLRAAGGTSIYPMSEGFVEKIGTWNKSGHAVAILHAKGVRTYYAHLGTIEIQPGQYVDKNTVIGTVGNSGNAKNTAPHIHLEVRVNGNLQDPGKFFEVPKFTNFDKSKEKLWVSQDAKSKAEKFDVKEHSSKVAYLAEKLFKKYSA